MGINFYRPFTRVFFAAQYFLFSFNAAFWHLASLILYTANTALLYLLVWQITRRKSVGLLAGLIFAVSSTHVEPVSWIADQTDLLALLCCLAGIIFYIKFRHVTTKAKFLYYGLALSSFILGLLNKESAAGFFLVPLSYDLLYGRFEPGKPFKALTAVGFRQAVVRQIPFFIVTGLNIGLRLILFGGIGGYKFKETAWQFSLNSFIELNFKWLIRPLQIESARWFIIVAVVAISLTAGVVFWERAQARPNQLNYRLTRALLFGLGWIILFLLPALSTPPSVRYVYISTAGAAIVIAVIFSPVGDFSRYSGQDKPLNSTFSQKALNFYSSPVMDLLKIILLVIFIYNAVRQIQVVQGMWSDTSGSMDRKLAQIKQEIPDPANYGLIYLTGIPLEWTNEYAPPFQVGFNEAVQIQYNNRTVETLLVADFPVAEARLNQGYFLEVRDGQIIKHDEILEALKLRNQQIKDKKEQVIKTENYNPALKLNENMRITLPQIPAPKLAGLEFTVQVKTPVQLKVEWLVDTPTGKVVRDTSVLTIERTGTYRVKPSNIALFSYRDIISEVKVAVPGAVEQIELVQSRLYSLP